MQWKRLRESLLIKINKYVQKNNHIGKIIMTWLINLNGVETFAGRQDSGRKTVGEMSPKIGIGHSR